jgi:hypothetical protein
MLDTVDGFQIALCSLLVKGEERGDLSENMAKVDMRASVNEISASAGR